MKTFRLVTLVVGVLGAAGAVAQAQNLLTNGNFESVPPEFPGWNVTESVVGHPELVVDSVGQQDFANQPSATAGQAGAWLKEFSGNVGTCCNMQNYQTNAILSQTVPGVAGQQYSFSGWSLFQQNYSGGVDTLDPGSPSGGVASPTTTNFTMEFLDSGSNVLGSPVALDLKADRIAQSPIFFANDASWYQHSLMGTAPAGTANVRVTAKALSMVANVDPSQSAFMDNFALHTVAAPGTELLTNANLNTSPSSGPELPGWTITETAGKDTAGRGGSFADDPASGGAFGYWLKAFANGDATLTQKVAGTAGGNYTFTASSAFGNNYSGGTSGTKPTTITLLKLSFLDSSDQVIGTPVTLDLWDAGQRNATGPIASHPEAWLQHSINGMSPAGTASVQVDVVATGMFATVNPDQGAFFDDLILTLGSPSLPGDFNHDNKVDAADYVSWRKGNSPTPNSPADYNTWRSNFGATSPGSGTNLLGSASVPEPGCLALAIVALLSSASIRTTSRRYRSATAA